MLVPSLMLFACLLGNNNTPEKSTSQNSKGDLILREGPSVEEGEKGDKLDKKVCNQADEIFETAPAASDVVLGQATIEERFVSESGSEDDYLTDILTPSLSLLIFNILMPCVDFYFDAALISVLLSNNWGCLIILVSALAANFIFTCYAWWRIEPRSQNAEHIAVQYFFVVLVVKYSTGW